VINASHGCLIFFFALVGVYLVDTDDEGVVATTPNLSSSVSLYCSLTVDVGCHATESWKCLLISASDGTARVNDSSSEVSFS